MMKSEFENLAGREVTNEQYRAIETLYMSSNLEKAEFVKSIRTMLKSIPQPERKKDIKRMVVRDRSGYRKTPNGCYYHIEYVELVDIDIKTGKYIIKPLEEKEKAMMNVSALFGENAAPDKRCGEGIVNILKAAVEEIYTGGLAKVTLNLRGGVKASISQNAKGEINVERTETKKQKLTE